MSWLVQWWTRQTPAQRATSAGLLVTCGLYLVHYAFYSTWLVEDAAISFAYAVNFAAGEGWVATPGAEPVEGFSNPTWTLLLAALSLIGLDPWPVSKLAGAVFGCMGIVLIERLARPLLPGRWSLVPGLMLATSTQYVLWNASGLENSLFQVFFGLGLVAWIDDLEHDRTVPWSALGFGLLAVTRPEAAMYAVVAGVAGALARWRTPLRALQWFVLFGTLSAIPTVLWTAYRYWYFAWLLPNTYYAKVGISRFHPWEWDRHGWDYLRKWALYSGLGFLIPVYLLGQTGLDRRRGLAGLLLAGIATGLLLTGAEWPQVLDAWPFSREPSWLTEGRIVGLIGIAAVCGAIGIGRDGWALRLHLWAATAAALFFTLYSGGDWMDGSRWLSLPQLPLMVLLTDAVYMLGHQLEPLGKIRRLAWSRVAPGTLLTLIALVGIGQTVWFLNHLEISPYKVGRRVKYLQGLQQRLHIDQVTHVEIDMGAHMWWSGFELIDIAGLVDVPMAHHRWEPAFVEEYIWRERQADFAHLHGRWAESTKITDKSWFIREYVEVPGFVNSRSFFHIGTYVKKNLFRRPSWEGTRGRKATAGKIVLRGWDAPAPASVPGGDLYLEVGLGILARPRAFRPIAFLARDGKVAASWDLPPAYDWIPLSKWRRNEVYVGRHSLPLPEDLAPGSYALGFVLVSAAEGVVPFETVPEGATLDQPVFARGEVRWDNAVEIAPEAEVLETLTVAEARLVATAEQGHCSQADAQWQDLRRALPTSHPWAEPAGKRVRTTLARCWADTALKLSPEHSVAATRAARKLDHHLPQVLAAAERCADYWEAQGDSFDPDEQPAEAYAAWRNALACDPTRTWVRRRAEFARAAWHNLEMR